MAPPQPSADTKPVKSQDDYINHGRDQLMAFLGGYAIFIKYSLL